MPATAVIPVLPFALPQGHRRAPQHGWKEGARTGKRDKQLVQAHSNIFVFAVQRGCVSSPRLILPEKSQEASSWKASAYET